MSYLFDPYPGRRRSNSTSATTRPRYSRTISSPNPSPGPSSPTTSTTHAVPRVLKKRHSDYVLSPILDLPPSPVLSAPPRPPRNPARATIHPPPLLRPKAKIRPSTSTGTREEVTPWELYPAPGDHANGAAPLPGASSQSKPQAQAPRPSTASSAPGLSISDLALRRRKSTGSKSSKARSNTIPPDPLPDLPPPPSVHPVVLGAGFLYPRLYSSESAPTTPKPPPVPLPPLTIPSYSSSSSSTIPKPPPAAPPNLKFSTADRTILEELKRNMIARKAQFVMKGSGGAGLGGVAGKKHHPYAKEEVPYPRNYEREVLDLDVWETVFNQQICESLTWHVFEQPPTKVLDLGCGTGTWILNCARSWRSCQFVGLDIVPLHPDLQQVGSSELASRITWVQANFLEGLPFPNEEFDFVHIKRIARGVPEDKWDQLLEEITRVMKPGGAFEMMEEDLFFPGKPSDNEDDSDIEYETDHRSRTNSMNSPIAHAALGREHDEYDVHPHRDTDVYSDSGSRHGASSPAIATTSTAALQETSPRSSPPLLVRPHDLDRAIAEDDEDAQTPHPPQKPLARPPPPQLHVKTQSHGPFHLNLHLPSRPLSQSKFAGSAASLLGAFGGLPVTQEMRPRAYTMSSSTVVPGAHPAGEGLPSQHYDQSAVSLSPVSPVAPPAKKSPAPFLLRTLPKPPANPRDHTLLETIYDEMHASRFINLAPLALLANSLGLYFKDVRTHPPLLFTFPPPPTKRHLQTVQHEAEGHHHDPVTHKYTSNSDGSDSDDARHAIHRPPTDSRPRKTKSLQPSPVRADHDEEANEVSEENRYLSMQSLIQGASKYVSLDDARMSAYSPSAKASFPAQSPVRGPGTGFELPMSPSASAESPHAAGSQAKFAAMAAASMLKARLPNATLNLDLRTLNLHLAMRTAEVLACSEAMWEWVLEYQAQVHTQKREQAARAAQRARSGSIEVVTQASVSNGGAEDLCKAALLDLTRDEFDNLLCKFEMDMRDQMALSCALEDRFRWSVIPSTPTSDRKIFDAACKRWDQWEQQQHRQAPSSHPYGHLAKHHRTMNSVATTSTLPIDGSPSPNGISHGHDDGKAPLKHNGGRTKASPRGRRYSHGSSVSGSSGNSTVTPPTRRLSRAMRVFVAWKA